MSERMTVWLPAKLREEADYFGGEPLGDVPRQTEHALARYLNEAADLIDALVPLVEHIEVNGGCHRDCPEHDAAKAAIDRSNA